MAMYKDNIDRQHKKLTQRERKKKQNKKLNTK